MGPGTVCKIYGDVWKATERKSAQYYRTVVYNDTIENSALIIAAGKQKLASLDPAGVFKFDMSVFEDV